MKTETDAKKSKIYLSVCPNFGFLPILLAAVTAHASTNCTLWFSGTNVASCPVVAGQLAKILSFDIAQPSFGSPPSGGCSITCSNVSIFVSWQQMSTNSRLPQVVGPATINANVTTSGCCTIQLDTAEPYPTPSTAVVIPTDSTGPVQIILESSADMSTWTQALPGTYGSSYSNRFFRVRAQHN